MQPAGQGLGHCQGRRSTDRDSPRRNTAASSRRPVSSMCSEDHYITLYTSVIQLGHKLRNQQAQPPIFALGV